MKTLRRIAVVIAALLIFTGSADAKIFRFGVKAGANFNKLSFGKEIANDINTANSAGWEAGAMVEGNIPLIGLGFDLSLMYARMNNAGKVYDDGELVYDPGQNFLMIPLNIRYKFSLPLVGQFLAPYLFTGPNFVFDLDKNTLKYISNRTCQIAWNVGIGVELINHLQIGASYNFGLGKVGNTLVNAVVGTNQPQYTTVKNNYWMVTAAYLF